LLGRLCRISNYAVKNLLDIEDAFGDGSLDARFSRSHLESEELGVSLFRHEPNRSTTHGHHHTEQAGAYVVISGSGRIRLDDELLELRAFDVVGVAAHVVRAFESGPDGLELIAVGGHRPDDGDAVFDADRWPSEQS
jgi:uncharacterized cupin superfamily protein